MDDAVPVCVRQRRRGLAQDLNGERDGKRPVTQRRFEGLPRDVLHDEVVQPVVAFHREHRDDSRVVEAGGGLRFTTKAGDDALVGG